MLYRIRYRQQLCHQVYYLHIFLYSHQRRPISDNRGYISSSGSATAQSASLSLMERSTSSSLTVHCLKRIMIFVVIVSRFITNLEMWANAQRDGRPAEHR